MSCNPCRVLVSDREYKTWSWISESSSETHSNKESDQLINPLHLKLFSDDLVDLQTPIPTILESPTRTNLIPAVLILEGNQTYGRTANQKRLLYKCIPNNPRLPAFLVPYQPDIEFVKTQKNRFVVFRFDNWQQKHPHGILTENLGAVDELPAFYEYQLYCRGVHSNIAEFTRTAKKLIKILPELQYIKTVFSVKNTRNLDPRIFTIDPAGSTDFDDAFSIEPTSKPSIVKIQVYIANVSIWLETMGLWQNITRPCTIYLPDYKRPMLPPILSESICSLTADGKEHIAFCMEIQFDVELGIIVENSVRFLNKSIVIGKNFAYESPELLLNKDYQWLQKCTQLLDESVNDSRDVVSFWMIKMNAICGELLHKRGKGVFRQSIAHGAKPDLDATILRGIPENVPTHSKRLISHFKHVIGKYVAYDQTTILEPYTHITSPIRRLVDLINQTIFQKEFDMIPEMSRDAADFVEKWTRDLPTINAASRCIRKTQIDCDMLYRCTAHPAWMQQSHPGVIFNRGLKPDGTYSYMVHLSDLRVLARFTSAEKYDEYQITPFRIFVFEDEDKLNKRIRVAPELTGDRVGEYH